jgi:hypothetical protein
MDAPTRGPELIMVILLTMFLWLPAGASAQEGNVCVQCHGALPGRLGGPVAQWKGSIHAANGIYCNECHGGDPKDSPNAMSPQRGFIGVPKDKTIPGVCGRCHVGVMKNYQASAHGKALGKGGPTCYTCHGNHAVQKASLDLINEKSCGSCHGYQGAAAIKDSMRRTEDHILALESGIGRFKGEGFDTDTLEKGLFSVRNRFHSLSHNVDVEQVKRDSVALKGELDRIGNGLQQMDDSRRKWKIAAVFAVGGALLAALLLYLLRRTYE